MSKYWERKLRNRRIIALADNGVKVEAIALMVGTGERTVQRALKEARAGKEEKTK